MNKIAIFTDSTVDILPDDVKAYNIHIIPFTVTLGEQSFLDIVEMPYDRLWEIMEENKKLIPKTSACSPEVYKRAWKPFVEDGYKVIHIGIGANLSGGYNAARIATQDFKEDEVYLVDSKNLSSAIGLLVLRAAKLAEEGKTVDDIVTTICKLRDQINCQFTIESLDYLYKGGRCSGMTFLIGKALKIHPILKVFNGVLKVQTKIRGHYSKALDFMIDEFKDRADYVDTSMVVVVDVANKQDAKYVAKKVKKILPEANIYPAHAGSVISTHAGPGTVGLIYFLKDENFK
jgi:DegV family protein with EDD domain